MGQPANKLATYNDLLDIPPQIVGEIIHGVLHTHPRPAPKHAVAASSLGFNLGGPYHKGSGGPGGWWILDEPELHLGDHIIVPDIAGWRRSRMPAIPDSAWFELPPDWVCEVISPSTAHLDRGAKRDICADFSITHLWHVDPDARILEAFELKDGQWLLLQACADNDEIAAVPFGEVPFLLGTLWAN